MAINKLGVDEHRVEQAIACALETFYTSLLTKINSICIEDIIKRKTPIYIGRKRCKALPKS